MGRAALGPDGWLTRWSICLTPWLLFALRDVVPAALHPNTVGFAAYYTESRVLLENPRDLHRVYDDLWFQNRVDRLFEGHVPELIQAQPPAMSLLMLPVAWMPPRAARVAWTLLNVALWLASLALLARALGVRWTWSTLSAGALGFATFCYRPLGDNLRCGQSYALLLLLLSAFFLLWLRPPGGRRWLAGLPLGVLLAVKSAGIWLLAQLAASRQWRVLGGAALAVALLVLPTCPILGWDMWKGYLRGFAWIAGDASRGVTAYQTVASFAWHLFVYEPRFNPAPIAHLPWLAPAVTAVVTVAAFIVSARSGRAHRNDAPFGARVLTPAMWGALGVSMAPLAEGHHYLLLSPSIACAWWWGLTSPVSSQDAVGGLFPRRWGWLVAATALVCVPRGFFHAKVLEDGWLALLAYPRLYGAFALWGWLVRELRELPPDSPRAAAQPAPAAPADLESSSRTT